MLGIILQIDSLFTLMDTNGIQHETIGMTVISARFSLPCTIKVMVFSCLKIGFIRTKLWNIDRITMTATFKTSRPQKKYNSKLDGEMLYFYSHSRVVCN